jgi:single-stranded DNA-specific DHH superfamily exonuclease
MIERLDDSCDEAVDILGDQDFIRIVSHYDADGITAAGIMCNALLRAGKKFHATLLARLDEDFIGKLERDVLVLICDMGSAQPDLINEMDSNVIVLDHHSPVGKLNCSHINPHLVGIDGVFEMSASGVAYALANRIGENDDLAGLAIAGAIGDKQPMSGTNKEILLEAVGNGVIATKEGLNIGDGDIREILEYSTDPYLDMSGDPERIDEFLSSLGLSGSVRNFSEDELSRLRDAILSKMNCPEDVIESLNVVYLFKNEVIRNAIDFVRLINAPGRVGKSGLALSLCLRDDGGVDEAYHLYITFQKKLISALKIAERNILEDENIRYVYTDERHITSALASTLVRYVFMDKPLLVLNRLPEKVKMSARGAKELVSHGLDLAKMMKGASERVGGVGGGHNIASGASIPRGREEEFIRIADGIVGEQLK